MNSGTLPPSADCARMALADIGYDPALVQPCDVLGAAYSLPQSVPQVLRWRATEISLSWGNSYHCCFACHQASDAAFLGGRLVDFVAIRRACDPPLPFTQDCGRDRSHP